LERSEATPATEKAHAAEIPKRLTAVSATLMARAAGARRQFVICERLQEVNEFSLII